MADREVPARRRVGGDVRASRAAATPTSRCRSTSRRRAARRSGTRTRRCARSAASSRSSTSATTPSREAEEQKKKPPKKPQAETKPARPSSRRATSTITLYVGPHGKAAVGRVLVADVRGRRASGRRAPRRRRWRGGSPIRAARSRSSRSVPRYEGAERDELRADRRAAARSAHRARRRRARARCRRRPRATSSGEFPVAELRELAKLGLLGVAVPEELGGAGAGRGRVLARDAGARARRCVGRRRGVA